MFLNKLMKYLGNETELATQLRSVLRLPKDEAAAQAQMGSFQAYLDGEIEAGRVKKGQLHPGRAPFFISCWWHLQNTEQWPIHYSSGRKALALEGLFTPTHDPVKDYFSFRQCFLSLASALKLKSWDLEHLFWRHEGFKQVKPPPPEKDVVDPVEQTNQDLEGQEDTAISHAQVQWLLAKIGKRLGCNIWIAANDHNKEWKGDRLGDLSIKKFHIIGIDPAPQAVIRLIDVLWLKGANQVVAAFEIEHTTSIYSGLLRMSDLVTSLPMLAIPLYIVAPEARLPQVRKELSRPTFQYLELHQRCGFFSNEQLVKEAENIMQWATDASAIEKFASKVPDVASEDMTVE
jgi:hypothetical protein